MKNKKSILAIDSAESFLKLALYADGKTYKTQKKTIKQEKYLFVFIEKLLGKAKLKFKDIDVVCVLKGPGRFTGIRIGLTLASIMQKFNKSKTFAVSLLDALCFETVGTQEFKKWFLKNPKGEVAGIIHAFREEYYLQFFKVNSENAPVTKLKALWLTKDDLMRHLKKQKSPLFITGWAKDYFPLSEIIKNKKYNYLTPSASGLNPVTLIEMVKTDTLVSRNLTPLYLKKARFEI